MAEEGGSRTHQTRFTRLIGFEVRAGHRDPIPFHMFEKLRLAELSAAPRVTGCPGVVAADHRRGRAFYFSPAFFAAGCSRAAAECKQHVIEARDE